MEAVNTLLKQLNTELQDKNKLLHELLENYKEKVVSFKYSNKISSERKEHSNQKYIY